MNLAKTRWFAPLALSILLLSPAARAGQQVDWRPLDINAAVKAAAEQGKLIYVFVEGNNCPPCDAFKKTHLSDPAFIDFVNTLYIPMRAHEGEKEGQEFLASLKLKHSAVPRFYVMSPEGRGLSMTIGMVAAPPMGAAEVLKLVAGRELPVDKAKAAALAGRLRAHAASQKASGAIHPDNPLRYLGVAILEAQAWALAGRPDEAEKAFGEAWADQLVDPEIRVWYVDFWLAWRRNLRGALKAAEAYQAASPHDPAGAFLVSRALAANGDYARAAKVGGELLAANPGDQNLAKMVKEWRDKAGMR